MAEDAGDMVGTAASVRFGSAGWLGGVTVVPRRAGAGSGGG